ncbi:MAG: hypothetical protein LRZ94_00950 [Candidatus Pacebacteria bacterium]|nr:hypothetical protein [Candidatus Paceibacterota bacterium]
MGGSQSLKKGKKGEYLFRKLCEKYGFNVVNQAEDKNKPDIRFEHLECEIKYRKNISKKLYDWLEEKQADILAVKRISKKDRNRDWLIVIPFEKFIKLFKSLKWQKE